MDRPGKFVPVPLRELVTQRQVPVVATKFADHVPVTIHLDGSMSQRKRAEPYKGAMFTALTGDIVFSKIDARNGAIGVIPSELAPAVFTPEFPIFLPKPDRLDGTFTRWILRTGTLLAKLRTKASGTSGRKRVTPDGFLDIAIPLPTLTEQQALVASYAKALADATAMDAQAQELEARGLAAFEAALGLTPPPPLPDRPMFVARFGALDRWSHEAVLRRITGDDSSSSPHPIVRLSDVIADLENGWSPKCLTRPAQGSEWGVLKLGAVSFGVFNAEENKALPAHLKPRPGLEIKPGQVLISRANVTRLVGATAYVETTPDQLILCDKIFRVVPHATPKADLKFVAQVLRLPSVRQQIEGKLTGTSPTMKNISKPALLGLTFPLPTELDDQKKLIADLETARKSAADLRDKATGLRRAGWEAFEATIFG